MSHANDLLNASAGVVFDHAGFDLPPGFLWADGGAVSRATYARLFNSITKTVAGTASTGSPAITGVSVDLTATAKPGMPISGPGVPAGATISSITSNTIVLSANATAPGSGFFVIAPWGIGDGSTTFNKPDLRGRVAAGRDDMGGTAANRLLNTGTGASDVVGSRLGAGGGIDRHTLDATQIPAHSHAMNLAGAGTGAGGNPQAYQGINTGNLSTSNNTGGGTAHPNVQPTAVCNKIVKT